VEAYIYIILYTIGKPRETIFIRFGGLKLRHRRAAAAEVEVVVVVMAFTVEVDMTAKEVVPAEAAAV